MPVACAVLAWVGAAGAGGGGVSRCRSTFSVRLPTGEHYCVGALEIAVLLDEYRAKRPDDPHLSQVWVYELAENGAVAAGPLPLQRFCPELGQGSRIPA